MRKPSKHAPVKVNASLRRREAAELRAQKMTLEEVGDKMGISESRVRQLLNEWDEQFRTENVELAEEIRQAQLDEIRLLKNVWFPRANNANAHSKDVEALLKLMVQEAKLTGAYAATETKSTLQGPNGEPIQTVGTTMDLSKLDTDKLLMLQAMLQDIEEASKKPD
jgi:predicted transcriptional regulator